MNSLKNIALIPIDNRPVCYSLPLQISQINPDINLILPDRKHLGDLQNSADVDSILKWLEKTENVDSVIISLDTIAYGGLVSSRRGCESYEEIALRINRLEKILKEKGCKNYAFSSIMRISNNNINEEEKEYWSHFGEKIFAYSYYSHKAELTNSEDAKKQAEIILSEIPEDVINDYLTTRKRNFDINKLYFNLAKENLFDTLVFSKDDCAQYGLNVKEAVLLEEEAKTIESNILVKTGADEIPLSLLSRAVLLGQDLKIAPVFTQPEYLDKISKYEDISVIQSVKSQIELAGCKVCEKNEADLIIYVNNFKTQQGELVMNVYEEGYNGDVDGFDKPYFVVDILNANGSDNCFVENILKKGIDMGKFYGYAAWNTTGNSLGSAICAAIMRKIAVYPDMDAFKRVQMIRFLDDWAYQANVRSEVKKIWKEPDVKLLKEQMKQYEILLNIKLGTNFYDIKYKFPWDRFFEIEVLLD